MHPKWTIVFLESVLLLGLVSCLGAEFHPKGDKVLFNRAMDAIQDKRFDVAGITFQTLINTYPDSKYAAMAKRMLKDHPHLTDCPTFFVGSCVDMSK